MEPALEPIPGERAAIVDLGKPIVDTESDDSGETTIQTGLGGRSKGPEERALVVADYHAGLEAGLHREGVSVPSRAADRRNRLCSLLDETDADSLVFLGDLAHSIGDPYEAEREELVSLLEAVGSYADPIVVKGNHDGDIEAVFERAGIEVTVTDTTGTRIGAVGFAHGHTWPAPAVLDASIVCVAHEHPTVRLTDSVGGRRVEPVWLRGALDSAPFSAHERNETASESRTTEAGSTDATSRDVVYDSPSTIDGDLVVFPAFNDLVGGTWVNVPEQGFLAPFLPEGLAGGEAYLLDGTRLGDYRSV
jgi:uncharacterized protein